MYLSAQLAQIASSIIGTRYENVDPCTVAQTHRYDCKREASRGRPTSKSEMGEGEHECVSGEEERTRKKLALQIIMRAYIVCIFYL